MGRLQEDRMADNSAAQILRPWGSAPKSGQSLVVRLNAVQIPMLSVALG